MAESMGLEPKGLDIWCYLLLYAVMRETLEFQRLERETLGTAKSQKNVKIAQKGFL